MDFRQWQAQGKSSLVNMYVLSLVFFAVFSSCTSTGQDFCPKIYQNPGKNEIQAFSSPFQPLALEERTAAWGREMLFGTTFAKDADFFRAITCFKRALILIPEAQMGRRLQAHYHIIQCYYWGGKYSEMIETFEDSPLQRASSAFPAYKDLLIMLRHAYESVGNTEQVKRFQKLLEESYPGEAKTQSLSSVLRTGQIEQAYLLAKEHPRRAAVESTLDGFELQKLSVKKAKTLNALLPGAGYFYVGQPQAALTSFTLNALFIAAAYHFFDEGNWAAGLVTLSLEGGWYFGGINGAGIAANEYNRTIYESSVGDLLCREKFFPFLTLRFSF